MKNKNKIKNNKNKNKIKNNKNKNNNNNKNNKKQNFFNMMLMQWILYQSILLKNLIKKYNFQNKEFKISNPIID